MTRKTWQGKIEKMLAGAGPTWGQNGAPSCSEDCKYHDGKRCELMGCRPDSLCEPSVVEMVGLLDGRGRT